MSELNDLIEAAGTAPKSSAILRAVLRAAADAVEPAPALEFLSSIDPAGHDEPTNLAVAGFLFDHDVHDAALRWCIGDSGPVVLLRARALLALGRLPEARENYAAALAEDVNLRSDDLDAALVQRAGQAASGTVVQLRPQLHSISGSKKPNDEKPSARPRVTFADIGGLEDVKAQIRRKIILPFEKKSLFDRFRKRAGGGVLLYGPPGCGKTLLARATAAECNAKFISVEIAEVLSMWIGESEKRLAHAFEQARNEKPSVLFFDEIEALAARRRFSEGDHKASMVSTFLNEFDGFNASNDGVLVLAATNVPWAVDPAFRRNGRFDRTLFVPPPDRVARKVILDIELKDRPQTGDIDTTAIAERTSGYSGADLANIVETACDLAIEDSIDQDRIAPISAKHLAAALKEVKPTTLEWLSQARNYAKFANEGGLYDDVVEFLDKFTR
ncbi:MAG: ATP-binding protein [Micropepsaceae bacterium]